MPFNYGVGIDFLRVPWTARRSNQSILKGIIPEYSLEGLMLKGKLQYFGHLKELTLWKRLWCWERLRAEGANRGWNGWMSFSTQWTWVWASSGRWWRTGDPGALQSIELQRVRQELATEQQEHMLGTSLSRVQGYPQDERHRRMNDTERSSFGEWGP